MRNPVYRPELTDQQLIAGFGGDRTLNELVDEHHEIYDLLLACSFIEEFFRARRDFTAIESAWLHLEDHLDHDNPTIAGVARWLYEMTDPGPNIIDLI